MNRFFHSGDAGDLISSLLAVRQLGGGEFVMGPHPHRAGGPREPMTPKKAAFMIPLLKAQPYITDARYEQSPEGITHDFTDLRLRTQKDDAVDSLADWHARHLGITEPLDTSPWLQCQPDAAYVGKVVFARSLRYNTPYFPWGELLRAHIGSLAFIGYAEEAHKILTQARGRLPIARFENALQMASIIAGSRECVMNQSFPLWVALGLGKKCTVSCWQPSPDVRLPRDNVRYVLGEQACRELKRSL